MHLLEPAEIALVLHLVRIADDEEHLLCARAGDDEAAVAVERVGVLLWSVEEAALLRAHHIEHDCRTLLALNRIDRALLDAVEPKALVVVRVDVVNFLDDVLSAADSRDVLVSRDILKIKNIN